MSNENTRTKLIARYQKLSLLQQRILQLRALFFDTDYAHYFPQMILSSSLHTHTKQKLTNTILQQMLRELVKQKFLKTRSECNPEIVHYLTQEAVSTTNLHAAENIKLVKKVPIFNKMPPYYTSNTPISVNAIYLAIYTNDVSLFSGKDIEGLVYCDQVVRNMMTALYSRHLDLPWLLTRHPVIQTLLCTAKLALFHMNILNLPPDLDLFLEFYSSADLTESTAHIPYLQSRLLQIDFAMGQLDKVQQTCAAISNPTFVQQESLAALSLMAGKTDTAFRHYEAAIKLFKVYLNRHDWFRTNSHSFFYLLILLQLNKTKAATQLLAIFSRLEMHPAQYAVTQAIVALKLNDRPVAEESWEEIRTIMQEPSHMTHMPWVIALIDWVKCLLYPEKMPRLLPELQRKFAYYQTLRHQLAAHLYAELILAIDSNDVTAGSFLTQQTPFSNWRFLTILSIRQPWEYAIDKLQQLLNTSGANVASQATQRLAWLLDPATLQIEPIEQKSLKKGWSAGRSIALKHLYNKDDNLTYLTAQDQEVIKGLQLEYFSWAGYSWNPRIAIPALIGHPFLFHAKNRGVPLELVKGELSLQVEKVTAGYHVSLSHHANTATICLEQETVNRYRVIDFSEAALQISQIISQQGITVPAAAKEKVLEIIRNTYSGITIHADVDADELPAVAGNTLCWVQLFPLLPTGLKITLWMRPFGEIGPYCRAGIGQATLIATLSLPDGEQRKKALRDLAAETASINLLLEACPTLAAFDHEHNEWHIDALEECLQIMLELDTFKKSYPVQLEWPKGQPFKLKQVVSAKQLSLFIKGSDYWFEYDGHLQLDENRVLDMKTLLNLLETSQGQFIKLAEGEFIALTESFRKQLQELQAISSGHKIHSLGTGVLQSLAAEAGHAEMDASWRKHLKKLQAMEAHQPVIPSTLRAELRDYQQEGFAYLSRLAHWQIGACLADDMGLGKTVQAIALLLEQATQGPCLVVAPTSVCFNWLEELSRFAPTLKIHSLNTATDRAALIQALDKMDVLISSYALLQQAGENLCQKKWQLIILDEAQAIKNSGTKRWQFATQLIGKVRLALTGTPIENHLGELWSIFRFLNPGLLGSQQTFQQRFASPIERNHNVAAKRALRNLVSPYILCRTKSQVLQALPAKTEQAILIEPSPEEMAFYEAVRSKAMERIQQLNETDVNNKRFGILAEITRLRQACCHSSLVDENINLESSKVKTFLNLVHNLCENNHKVLVFSQYVRYLQKIKTVLTAEHISYCYLDGSTPAQQRQAIVTDFQTGNNDVFLISLKAGGTGLNLTAADYVIILDPWWNPAVEDQAAARAHRLGQIRPVTVYRLIMKNSIEEKIVQLHQDKRDLASDLLSGGDVSGKLSEAELINLIAG